MEESELEEGEACSYNHNNDYDGSIDPDNDLSYIDERIQDVLGHFQKDFEGGVSAENLGAKFGGYGSFLPSYHRSPVQSHPKTPPKAQNYSRSPNSLQVERGLTASSSVPKTVRPGPASSSVMSLSASKALSSNGSGKQKTCMTLNQAETSASRQESAKKKSSVLNKQNSLKFRLKVVSDKFPTEKNSAIYSGLGLDESPSLSVDDSLSENEGMYSERQDFLLESPTSILMVMTSLPLDRDLLLSPLSDDLIYFTEKKKASKENKYIQVSRFAPKSSHVLINYPDSRKDMEKGSSGKKQKSMDSIDCSMEKSRRNRKNVWNGIDAVAEKEIEIDSSYRSPFDTVKDNVNVSDTLVTFNGVVRGKGANDGERGLLGPVHHTEPVLDENPRTSSAGSVQEDTKEGRKDRKYKGEKRDPFKGKKASKGDPNGSVKKQKASDDEQDGTKLVKEREHQLSGGKKKLKQIQRSAAPKSTKKAQADMKSRKQARKVKETYKDFFGDTVESEEEKEKAEQNSYFEIKGSRNSEKRASGIDDNAERLSNKKTDWLVAPESHKTAPNIDPSFLSRPISDATHAISNPVLIQEHWVGCDKCGKWRLLPLGMLPDNLPEKWMCTMLNWLPGKNNCNVPEEETTNTIMAMYQVPASEGQGIMQSNTVSPNPVNTEEDLTNKRKKGLKDITYETDKGGPAMQESVRNGSINPSHFATKPDAGKSSDMTAERDKYKRKERTRAADQQCDGGGDSKSSKMKSKRDADRDKEIMLSKKMKMESFLFSDDEHVSEYGGAERNECPCSSSGMPAMSAGRNQTRYNGLHKESQSDKKHWPEEPAKKPEDDGSLVLGNNDDSDAKRKRKIKESHDIQVLRELSENEHRKEKKARVSKYEGKETSLSKGNAKSERKSNSSSKRHFGHAQNTEAAGSSSSKISDSQKLRTSFHEAKGSPVESVSSSPMRILNPDKVARRKKDESRDANFCATAGLKRYSDGEDDGVSDRSGTRKNDKNRSNESSVLDFQDKDFVHSTGNAKERIEPSLDVKNHNGGNGSANDFPRKDQSPGEGRQNSDQWHSNGSRPRKSGISSSARSKNKNQSTRSDLKNDPRSLDRKKSNRRLSRESIKTDNQSNFGGDDNPKTKADASIKPNMPNHYNAERNSKRIVSETNDKAVIVTEKETSPPSSKAMQDGTHVEQSLPVSASNNVGKVDILAGDSSQVDDVSKMPIQVRKNDNLGLSFQNGHFLSPLRREPPSNQAANNALKEATELKHKADRLKKSGSNLEIIGLYFHACLKFLHGASLLELCSSENVRQGEMLKLMHIYSTTAKLCGYCAHEYEKLKDMAAAALAYKCMEVAYMRVVYSSHMSTNRYRHELQTLLQMAPPGESPSSSASDVDNLNQPATADKVGTSKGLNSPQVAGNHVISAQNRPNLHRLLQFAQDVAFAMDASRKSRIAFTAASVNLAETQHGEDISSIQSALDYNFHDVQGLLRLVRLAMEAINR